MHAPLVSKDLESFSAASHDQPPRHLGSRYNADGEFLPEPGNTVVCHLAEGSKTESAIIGTRQRFLDMPEAPQTGLHAGFQPAYDGISGHYRISPCISLLAGRHATRYAH